MVEGTGTRRADAVTRLCSQMLSKARVEHHGLFAGNGDVTVLEQFPKTFIGSEHLHAARASRGIGVRRQKRAANHETRSNGGKPLLDGRPGQ